MTVEVRIEELVLHGFPPADRHRIAGAIQHELSRLFTETGAPTTIDGDLSYLGGLGFEIPREARGEEIGTRVAGSLHRGLTR